MEHEETFKSCLTSYPSYLRSVQVFVTTDRRREVCELCVHDTPARASEEEEEEEENENEDMYCSKFP
jgi:hypothetical protein